MSCEDAIRLEAEIADLCLAIMRMLYRAFSLVDLESSSRNHLQQGQHCLAKSPCQLSYNVQESASSGWPSHWQCNKCWVGGAGLHAFVLAFSIMLYNVKGFEKWFACWEDWSCY